MLGDKGRALEYLESYARTHPDDEKTKTYIEGIKAGTVKSQSQQVARIPRREFDSRAVVAAGR
jgi:hypothetical protein